MAKRGPKRNRHQKAVQQQQAAELRAEGHSLREIANIIPNISHQQVRLDLREIEQSLLNAAKEDIATLKAQQVAKLRWAQIQTQKSWNRSLEDAVKTTEKFSSKNGMETTTTIEGQSGNSGHMTNYLKAVEKESELLGLFETDPDEEKELTRSEEILAEQIKIARENHESRIKAIKEAKAAPPA